MNVSADNKIFFYYNARYEKVVWVPHSNLKATVVIIILNNYYKKQKGSKTLEAA